jgi:DNA (cytosine-5)-methyltransferase 1
MATFGSLFAGVGGFDIGFDNAGWECGFQVEWDKHCQQVLTHHWPEVPKWWDVSEVNGAELPPVDLITFGSPCQDLSLAGKRAGLMEGSRSNLFFEATRIIKEMRDATNGQYPRWAIWENVAGAFSSNKGEDFDAVLQEMVNIGGHHVEWHCMDAQFYGVPQRRRRVFVIACFDSAILERGGEALLPVGEGRRRNTSTRNKERKALAATLGKSVDSSSGRLDQRVEPELPWAAGSTDDDVLTTSVTSKWHKGSGGPSGSEHYNLFVEPFVKVVRSGARDAEGTLPAEVWRGNEVAPTLNVFDNTGESRATVVIAEPMLIDGTRVDDVRIYESPVQTLAARMGTGGNNVPMVAVDGVIGFSHTQGLDAQPSDETFPTLRSGGAGQAVAIPIQDGREIEKHQNGLGIGEEGDPSYTLDQTGGQAVAQEVYAFPSTFSNSTVSETAFPTLTVGSSVGISSPPAVAYSEDIVLPISHAALRGGGQAVAYPIQGTIIGRSDTAGPQGRGVGEDGDPMYTLDTISAHGVAVAYTGTSFAQYAEGLGTLKANGGDLGGGSESLIVETDIAPTLRSGGDGGVPSSRGEHLVVEAYDEYNDALGGHVHQALRAGTKQSTGVLADMVVRRLTPVECERLMGWPDNHTLYRADGTTNSDTTRYKMCGNGVASPVAEWIARHILGFHTAL